MDLFEHLYENWCGKHSLECRCPNYLPVLDSRLGAGQVITRGESRYMITVTGVVSTPAPVAVFDVTHSGIGHIAR